MLNDEEETMKMRVLYLILQLIDNVKNEGEKLYLFTEMLYLHNFFKMLEILYSNDDTKISDQLILNFEKLKTKMLEKSKKINKNPLQKWQNSQLWAASKRLQDGTYQ